MNNLRFRADGSLVKKNLRQMKRYMSGGNVGRQIKKAFVDVVETNVKTRFEANSTRNPALTPKGPGVISRQILSGITTSQPIYSGNAWKVGVGDKEWLDNIFVGDGQSVARIWEILEKGAQAHTYGPSAAPDLQFWWYRVGRWFVGMQVKHPGQQGRHYFFTINDALYASDLEVIERLAKIFYNSVKLYSR